MSCIIKQVFFYLFLLKGYLVDRQQYNCMKLELSPAHFPVQLYYYFLPRDYVIVIDHEIYMYCLIDLLVYTMFRGCLTIYNFSNFWHQADQFQLLVASLLLVSFSFSQNIACVNGEIVNNCLRKTFYLYHFYEAWTILKVCQAVFVTQDKWDYVESLSNIRIYFRQLVVCQVLKLKTWYRLQGMLWPKSKCHVCSND